ncbi:MAG: GNAT family N-acetyltransferase, partial [Lachnospiraceae bacterium]|nr:GNAT family N-acetyltransferase [Lachnospiraceae bacterium]
MCEIVKNVRNSETLRKSFNKLAKETFDLDFEDWYQNGFWRDKYIPYSMVIDGEVAANVSVNRTDMLWNGRRKHLIQLGTVMTKETYRNRGLIRRLMEEIAKDFATEADGIYLFANDSVLDFYPKFGFRKAVEWQYSKKISAWGE